MTVTDTTPETTTDTTAIDEKPASAVLARMNAEAERLALEAQRAGQAAQEIEREVNMLNADQQYDAEQASNHEAKVAHHASEAEKLRAQMKDRERALEVKRGLLTAAQRASVKNKAEAEATTTIIWHARKLLAEQARNATQNGNGQAPAADAPEAGQ